MTSNFEHRLSTIAFDKVINDLTAEFVGRDWLFEKINAWLEGPQARCLLLIGEPGVGKSAIAARLIKSRRDVVAHHFCIAGRNDTILPTHVLLSIAAQLMTRVPGYAEALANVVRPLHLTVQVKINAESLLDGHVQGVVINHLYASNSAEILDLVLRRPFQFCKPMEPITIVIDSLDEAATLTGGENLLSLMVGLATLPDCVRLVMTTRRDETRVMPYLTHLSPAMIEIPTRTAEAEQDIADYARLRLASPEVRDALQLHTGDPIDGVTAKVVKLAEGNFLYTRVLFDELSAKHVTLDDLDTLPSEIDELYKRFLTRLLPEWHQGYQTILTILAVAVEPIAEADLTALTDELMGETELRRKLGVLRQFLDETIPFKGAPSRFTLFHNSLQNYLTDQARAQQFWCSAREGNRLITGVCWRHHPNRWRTCSVYGLRNCARHLYVLTQLETNPNRIEQASERLHDLFVGKTDSAENSWLDAKSRLGDLTGYIADLELARLAAQNIFQEDRPRSLGLQCRYALFLSSLASVARNITPNLLVRLTRDGLCTPEQAIAYADSAPGGDSRAELLAALVPVLGETHTDQVLGRLMRIPLRDSETALSAIVLCPSLSETWLHRIWDVVVQQGGVGVETSTKLALRLPSVAGAAFALAAKETNPNFVGPYLDRSIKEWTGTWPVETLEFFRAIQSEEIRSDVISRLGPRIPSAIQDPTIDLAFAIKDKRLRAIALTGVAGFLKGQQIELALKAVMENGELYSRGRVLLDLTSSIPAALDSAEMAVLEWLGLPGIDDQVARLLKLRPGLSDRIHQTARKWDDAHPRANILTAVMPFRPEAGPDTLDAIAAVDDADNRLYKLSRIWPVLPSGLWTRALAMIGPWQDSWKASSQRAKAVAELSPHCPTEHYPAVLSLIRSIAFPRCRAEAASSFAIHVSSDASDKFVHEIFDDLEKHAVDDVNAFAGLAPVLPQAAWRTLELVPRLHTEYQRSQIIDQILPALSKEMLEKAFRCVQLHYDFPEQAAALDILSQFDGTFTDWSIECAKSILEEDKRAAALTHLLPSHPELGDAAIAAVAAIPVASVREEHLEKLIAKLSPSYWSEVQKIVEGFETSERIRALTAIAKAWPGLGADSMLAAELSRLNEAGSPTRRHLSVDNVAATLRLIDRIEAGTASVLAEALNMAMSIDVQDRRRAYALARLVPYLTDSELDQVQKTLDASFEIPDPLHNLRRSRRELQVAVAIRRPDLRDRALDVVLAENPTGATDDLERLLPALSVQQLTRVADAVASCSATDRARAYGHLAPFLPGADALAVTAALEIEPGERTKTLVWLSRKTPAAVPHAVRAARDHYELLSEIPNFETVAFAEAMDCIPKLEFINNQDYRAEAIEKLTPALLKLESGERHSQLQKILLVGARRERTEMLKDLKALIPIIHSLGSGGAIREVGNAIRLVTGFWP